jgi:hypothetical protein
MLVRSQQHKSDKMPGQFCWIQGSQEDRFVKWLQDTLIK